MKANFGVVIKYKTGEESKEAEFLRRIREETRHQAILTGINELIKMGAQQNFIPNITEANATRISNKEDGQ